MARERKLTPEELALIKAQTTDIGARTAQSQQELAQKAQLAREQITSDQLINASKLDLGRLDIGQKEKQAQLEGAMNALGLGSKESIAAQSERGAIASDLAKRPDIDQKTLATTLAESGQPGLYNALARGAVDKREQLINSMLPALRSASSDAEREKKIKPALDALGPDVYPEALARAFPKPGVAVPAPTPALWSGGAPATSTATGTDWAGLANTLLGKSGVTPGGVTPGGGGGGGRATAGAPEPYPTLNLPDIRYTGLGHGPLEGSKVVKGGIETPSGGFIGGDFTKPRYAALIAPRGTTAAEIANQVPAPAGIGDLVKPPPLPAETTTAIPYDQLLAGGGAPTPTPAPLVMPTATPVLQATPAITPMTPAMLAELQRRAGY